MAGQPLLSPGDEGTEKVRFGNFEVINDPEGRPVLLGKGTFGRTYQARHCFLDTIVALKIITERYVADAAVRQRFLTEARAVAKLSHPHIARLYDFGEMNGVLHYAMEYCGGGSLADHVAKQGPLPLRQTIEIAQQISGALKCAHTAGFIHRDLKPSNIMLTTPDAPLFAKLIDFGLVQPSVPGATGSFGDDQSLDGARFLGTPLFASPEQLREEPMDVRTDLFSLGITLWFLLEGRAPESGSSAEIAASRLSRESYAARLPTNLPPQFRDLLARLLEKDRKNRFGTAAEVFKALNACAAALGFRRARDYTDPSAALEWEDAETTEMGAPDSTRIEPAEMESVEAELSSQFNIVARINEDFTGLNYIAEEVGKNGAMSILHVLHPMLLDDGPALERFRVHIAQLMRVDVNEIVRPKSIKRYSDYVAVISDKPEGADLLSVLRTKRTVPLIEAAPLLEKIADVCDRLCAAGVPGAQLAPGRISVERSNDGLSKAQPRLYPRFLAVSEAPELAQMNEPEDASSTMTTDMLGDPGRADNMGEHFASLLYRIVAGRNCPVASSLSTQAYVAVPGLSEQSNRILAMVIARQVEDSPCGQVLHEILKAEGIVHREPGHASAGFTERPGSSTVSPLATPPVVVPADRTPSKARSWKPPTVATPMPKPAFAKPVPSAAPVMPPARPAETVPPRLPKERVPAVSEAKVESKRTIEPPLATPVPKAQPEKIAPKPVEARPKEAPVVPVTPLPTPVEAILPPSPPTRVPPASPKESMPAVSETKAKPAVPVVPEVKVESKHATEPRVPVEPKAKVEPKRLIEPVVPAVSEIKVESKRTIEPPISPSKPAPEVVPKLVEALAKDSRSVPIEQKRQETVQELEKPAPVVPPKVAKTREEKKAAVKQAVSPLPVEKPPLVTPKVMPAPEIPITARRSADAEEEPQVWDARKLKPIGIGIAALLAISVSYVGVKALTKPQTKPPPLVAQPSPASPQPMAKTNATAAPKIAATTETVPPSLTDSATEPVVTQSAAPPNQSPETPALTSTSPAAETKATENVAAPNQDAVNPDVALKPTAPEQPPRTQPGQPQIAGKQEPENAPSTSARTRSSGAGTRSGSSGTSAKTSGGSRSTTRSSAAANPAPPPPARPAAKAAAPPKAPSEQRQRRRSEFQGVPGG
jgi:serine/threonine protein kinase